MAADRDHLTPIEQVGMEATEISRETLSNIVDSVSDEVLIWHTPARLSPQILYKQSDLGSVRDNWVDTLPLTDQQKLRQAARIRVDRAWRPPQIDPDPQPLRRPLVPAQDRPLLLQDHRHSEQGPSARGDAEGQTTDPRSDST